ncbi:hypothetical protein WA1_34230 [Scytonema hofmannii PCC 7110]|uniref:Uncharacterized protein n=1 Tax=Scytonema hofmannii PCC 7110 TaxID=128403 RepID=A0A139X306_9CYAN|nr:hypothetical protein WA1_34230 [Scytonema hofmannii PCC 7110]
MFISGDHTESRQFNTCNWPGSEKPPAPESRIRKARNVGYKSIGILNDLRKTLSTVGRAMPHTSFSWWALALPMCSSKIK